MLYFFSDHVYYSDLWLGQFDVLEVNWRLILGLVELDLGIFYAVYLIQNMGLLCSRNRRYSQADAEENAQVSSSGSNLFFWLFYLVPL